VPTNFLTEDQRKRYGRFTEIPDEGQLAGSFLLDQAARRRARAAKGSRNRIGWAIQLGTLRYLRTTSPERVGRPCAARGHGLRPVAFGSGGTARPVFILPRLRSRPRQTLLSAPVISRGLTAAKSPEAQSPSCCSSVHAVPRAGDPGEWGRRAGQGERAVSPDQAAPWDRSVLCTRWPGSPAGPAAVAAPAGAGGRPLRAAERRPRGPVQRRQVLRRGRADPAVGSVMWGGLFGVVRRGG
jgi:hypothetical protein